MTGTGCYAAARVATFAVCFAIGFSNFTLIELFAADPLAGFERDIKPLLESHCYDCHGNGAAEGNFVLDGFASPEAVLQAPELWWRVVKNLRAGVMPPPGSDKLTDEQRDRVYEWVKVGPFGIDPDDIDPGPLVLRRLNREEYGNTVRELMGVPFDEKLIFPPDDSGHGFDNVADAMMVSPLLLEKYLQAAELIVERAVPKVTRIIPRQDLDGSEFRAIDDGESRKNGRSLNGKEPAKIGRRVTVDEDGIYSVTITVKQHGSFEFDPARYIVRGWIDEELRFEQEFGWDENKRTDFVYRENWSAGEHGFVLELEPVKPGDDESDLNANTGTNVSFQLQTVSIEGPEGTEKRVHPANYERFFPRDEPPSDPRERRSYAEEVLAKFVMRAHRGRVDPTTLNRLVDIAEANYSLPDVTFEAGISRAMVAALVSPRFIFRIESASTDAAPGSYVEVDEVSLAARLSYFLWSTMPDEELFALAEQGRLREQLPEQIDRMLRDRKAEAFVSNFVGQWLRTRDVINATVDPAVVLGVSEELESLREWMRGRFRRGRGRGDMSDEDRETFARFREIQSSLDRYNDDLKRAMRRETEMLVEHIVRTDASLLDILDCDYTFLNDKLAEHYGIPGVEGGHMRLVKLPADSPRGGVLTHASMLMITSNPTRTSPVKRGLFVLDNILGTPAPPAPAAVPELEASADRFEGREPSLRELLQVHRENALCASCHARMDPLGLALENFDALGMWRERDGEALIEPQGTLVTGEAFSDIRELKALLRERHAKDFYRCVTEKLLVFAIGRGIEFTDEHTVDQIVDQLEIDGGQFKSLILGVVQSSPFQKQRVPANTEVHEQDLTSTQNINKGAKR